MSVNVVKTKTELAKQRWLRIIADKLETGDSHKELANRFGVSTKTIERALDWGRKQGLFEVNARERLFHHIIELTKQLDWINEEKETAIEMTRDETGKRTMPIPSQQLTALSRELRETRIAVMELEGLYWNVRNIIPANMGEEKDIKVTWRVVDADEGK